MSTAVTQTTRRGEGGPLIVGGWATALLYNSLRRYEEALAVLADVVGHGQRDVGTIGVWALVEYVEAATRAGELEGAADIHRRLTERTGLSGMDWALTVEARCRAPLTSGEEAKSACAEAVERLGRSEVRGELGRAQLLYAEWLRRRGRRGEAG
ncbi:hypothetical protein [Streptomyces sp. NPDC086010]|uniref:hypothetical protein n=1 Tax=Streptomyces sp. NPDC086010 TaxID=3365745 RepID=UPI0037D1E5D9